MLAELSMTPTRTVNSFIDDTVGFGDVAKGKNSEIVVLVEDSQQKFTFVQPAPTRDSIGGTQLRLDQAVTSSS